jgi:ADP-ribosylglycohydrolase
LDSHTYEDAVRNAISLGGDADTMACIAGGIAQAFYREIPPPFVAAVRAGLPADLLQVVDRFNRLHGCPF